MSKETFGSIHFLLSGTMNAGMWLHLPVVLGIILGDEERYGKLDTNGNFQELEDPLSAPYSRLETLRGKLALEYPCSVDLLDASGKAIAVLYIGVVSGRAACVSISALEGQELTGQVLRQAPISSLVREAARGSLVHLREGFAVRFAEGNSALPSLNEIPSTYQRRVLNDEFLVQVAEIYRNAVAMGVSTQHEIQAQLGPISDAAARRWVMMARRAGFLGDAPGPWKSGEATAPRNRLVEPSDSESNHRSLQREQ